MQSSEHSSLSTALVTDRTHRPVENIAIVRTTATHSITEISSITDGRTSHGYVCNVCSTVKMNEGARNTLYPDRGAEVRNSVDFSANKNRFTA